jgi:hypothetical protein
MNPRSGVAGQCSVTAAVSLLLAGLAGSAWAGYGLELIARGDTVQHVSPSAVGEFHFTLTNTGTSPDVFEFDCRVVSGVPGWTVVYCVGGQCVEPGMTVYDTLSAGASDTAIKVSVYTTATEGEEVVSLHVRSMGDTTQAESVRTHTIVGSAIEERSEAAAHGIPFRVAPEPVRRGGQAGLSFSTGRSLRFSVDLFDAAGGWVSLVADGTAPGGRHVINWRPDRHLAPGIYLLRLKIGDESVVRKLVVE